jgi:hypothetical protein
MVPMNLIEQIRALALESFRRRLVYFIRDSPHKINIVRGVWMTPPPLASATPSQRPWPSGASPGHSEDGVGLAQRCEL